MTAVVPTASPAASRVRPEAIALVDFMIDYHKEPAERVRKIAGLADRFTKRRLLAKASLTTIILLSASVQAWGENCRALPAGPERRACAIRENPERFQSRLEKCRQLSRERGNTGRTGTGAGGPKEFVRDCMQGKQR